MRKMQHLRTARFYLTPEVLKVGMTPINDVDGVSVWHYSPKSCMLPRRSKLLYLASLDVDHASLDVDLDITTLCL